MFGPLARLRETFDEYPQRFWVLVAAGFIDGIGGTMLFPFFALYVTQRFGVGMSDAGLLLGIFSIAGLAGSTLGGALTDRFGRRGIVLFGLVFSATSAIAMGLVDQLSIFYPLAALVGFLGSIGDPARTAMIADLLPDKQRAEGYGIMRVTRNLAWIIGPTVGGLAAQQSYLWLFVADAITSTITAIIVYRLVPETMRPAPEGKPRGSIWGTFAGYRLVAADRVYLGFILASMLMLLVYGQMYSTLGVYLRDVHAVPSQGYGLILSLDAAVVVVAQLWVTRRIRPYPPMAMMAAGSLLYMVGFAMYGIVPLIHSSSSPYSSSQAAR